MTAESQLLLDPIAYVIRRSVRAKRILISISAHKGVELIIPHRAKEQEALAFLEERKDWVLRQLSQLGVDVKEDKSRPSVIDLKALSKVYLLDYLSESGDAFRLHVSTRMKIGFDRIAFLGAVDDFSNCLPKLRVWLKKLALEAFSPQIKALADEMALSFNQLTFRFQRTRWGSCSQDKNINLNVKLLFLSPGLVRYVMIHELCHLVHMNHGKHFWSLVAKYAPDFVLLEKELKKSVHELPKWAQRL